VAKVQAPPHTRIAWFSAGAAFRTYFHAAAQNTNNTIAYALDPTQDYEVIYRANVPTDNEHWNYNADREVKLDTPARNVYIRYFGEPALNNIRIYAHCVEDRPRPSAPVRITHVWQENGKRRSRSITMKGPGSYQIIAANDPVDESIEMSVPSDVRPRSDRRRSR
jgi:hypothetical protein